MSYLRKGGCALFSTFFKIFLNCFWVIFGHFPAVLGHFHHLSDINGHFLGNFAWGILNKEGGALFQNS